MIQLYYSYYVITRRDATFKKYTPLAHDRVVPLDNIIEPHHYIRAHFNKYHEFLVGLKSQFGCRQVIILTDSPNLREHFVVFRFKSVDDLVLHKLTYGRIDGRFIEEFTSQ